MEQVYLGDVLDHVEGVLSSLDLFSGMFVPPFLVFERSLTFSQRRESHRLYFQRSQLQLEYVHQRVCRRVHDAESRLTISRQTFDPLGHFSSLDFLVWIVRLCSVHSVVNADQELRSFGMNFGSVRS